MFYAIKNAVAKCAGPFARVADLLRDERGNTPANVVFLILVIGLGGVAVDTGNAFRMRTMMQATADAAVLAAVQELSSDPDNAGPMAMFFVEANMPRSYYGDMTEAAEVRTGRWDPALRTINVGATPPNAVGVILERNETRNNALTASLLKITGFKSWEIAAGAVAIIETRECESADGMIANGIVDFNSVDRFGDNFCVYGRQGINMNNNNDFTGLPLGGDGTGALIGTGLNARDNYGCLGFDMRGSGNDPCDFSKNPGLAEAMFHSDGVRPTRAEGTFAADMAAYQAVFDSNGQGISPGDFYRQCEWSGGNCGGGNGGGNSGNGGNGGNGGGNSGNGGGNSGGGGGGGGGNGQIEASLQASMITPQAGYRTFYFKCDSESDTLQLNSGHYQNMAIITNCMIHINGGVGGDPATHSAWDNVTVVSVSDSKFPGTTFPPGKNANIQVSGGNQFGQGCGLPNSVYFFSSQSIEFAGNNRYRGVEITAQYDLIMAGNQTSYVGDIGSFSAHVGGDIHFTSSSDFVACPIGPEKVVVEAKTSLVF